VTTTDQLAAAGIDDPDGHRDPWDQWPDEPPAAYSHFARYRDLGRVRTVKKLAAEVERTPAYLWKLASTWSWVERAGQWDREQDRLYAEEMLDARVVMGRQHMQLANLLIARGVEALRNLDPKRLTPRELREYLEAGIKLQRLIAGEVTDRTEQQQTDRIDLSEDETRQELAALHAELERRMAHASAPVAHGQPPG
jgi:hypothetical protein